MKVIFFSVLCLLQIEGEPSLYMALLHGDFLLWLGDIESVAVYSSSNITFSDNSWHVVHLQLSNSGYVTILIHGFV